MVLSARRSGGRQLAFIRSVLAVEILTGAVLAAPVIAAEDEYLTEIEAEAVKVDPRASELDKDPDATPTIQSRGRERLDADIARDLSQKDLEEFLAANFQGSFLFYRKLPARTQGEVYESYLNGASMREIRKKIMTRFLHR